MDGRGTVAGRTGAARRTRRHRAVRRDAAWLLFALAGIFAQGAVADAGAQSTADPRAAPTIATLASPEIELGAGALTDTAVVLGRVDPQPGATLAFALYGPDDAACAGQPLFQSINVPYPVAGGPVTSAAFRPPLPGIYRWRASYSGDANNLPVTGACNDPWENVVVRPERSATPLQGSSSYPLLSPFPVIRVVGLTTRRGVRVALMTVRAAVGSYIVSRCTGSAARCPYRERIELVRGRIGQVRTVHVRGFERSLRAGIVLRVYVVSVGMTGKFTSFRILPRRNPVRTDRCVIGIVLRPAPCPDS